VEHNRERFAKRIVARPRAEGRLILAPDASDELPRIERAMRTWPADGSSRAVLARTNRELLTAVVAAVELDLPFRAPDLPLPIEDPRMDELLRLAVGIGTERPGMPLLVALGAVRGTLLADAAADPGALAEDGPTRADLATALLGWAAPVSDTRQLRAAVEQRRRRLVELRREDAALTLATAHGTKGLEWDHVLVLADGFPGRRSISDASEPERALEEERRLAYVAWTRARRSLTLVYDPAGPSRFLREAFGPGELGSDAAAA
jgi:superfamily I DNA/RNA helicase